MFRLVQNFIYIYIYISPSFLEKKKVSFFIYFVLTIPFFDFLFYFIKKRKKKEGLVTNLRVYYS